MRGLKYDRPMLKNYISMSHPLWMRGLKYFALWKHIEQHDVASFMDAWIEILFWRDITERKAASHPLWMRGLK